jgi:hypothetical protein
VQGRMSRRRKIVAAMPARTALPHLSPHDLRHTYRHRWLVGGGDIYTLSRILGHASVKVTDQHYAYLLKEDIREGGPCGSRSGTADDKGQGRADASEVVQRPTRLNRANTKEGGINHTGAALFLLVGRSGEHSPRASMCDPFL